MKDKKTPARLLISIILLVFILYRIDFSALRGVLSEFSPVVYLGGLFLVAASQLTHAGILKLLLGAGGRKGPGIMSIFRALAVAVFFGIFLPGSAGPDIVLAYNLSRAASKKERILSAIVIARGAVLASSILVALIASWLLGPGFFWLGKLYLLLLAVFAVMAFLALYPGLAGFQSRILSFLKKNRWTHLLYKTYFALSEYSKERAVFAAVIPASLLAAFLRITIDYTVSRALGISIPLHYFLAFVPVISLAAILPVSISGIGVRESAYVEIFRTAGFEGAGTFSISILSFTLGVIFALFGAVFYIRQGAALKRGGGCSDAG